MSAGTVYGKRYAGGFLDLPTTTTPIDSAFLNAVEAALLQLIGAAPTADGQVAQWDNVNTRYGPALLLNKNIDAAAAIAKSKLDFTGANGIVNADIAAAAAIARSKLNFGSGLVQADMAPGNKVTTGTMASGPPGAPSDGDIWIATNVDANGTRWAFQFNAGSASAFKWEFIGGAPARAKVTAGETTGTLYTNYADLTTVGPSVVAARAGDYLVRAKCNADNNTAASQVAINFRSTTVAEDDDNLQYASSAIANAEVPLFTEGALFGVAAGDTIKVRYTVILSGTGTFRRRHIAVTPIRVA